MHILIVLPRSRLNKGAKHRTLSFAPVTLPLLAALVPPGNSVDIVDEQVDDVDLSSTPDLVGITAMTGTVNRAYDLARRFRAKGCTVVLGGVHPSLDTDEALEHVDAVCIGAAHESWPQCIRDFAEGKLRKKYHASAAQPVTRCPPPRRDLLNRSKYWTVNTIEAAARP